MQLRVVGEIFSPPLTDTSTAQVSDVNAQKERPSHFVLPPGSYEYHFHVDNGAGVYTVSVTPEGAETPIVSKKFDTKFGFSGRVLRFEVAP
ncbi:hypothetical protein [Sorangium sp. So ce1000]|uniref:hypothetical protein n=1 Tax=Sorangium sp. So ce1000 TaxID=3133325 RepID=UPI003F640DF4